MQFQERLARCRMRDDNRVEVDLESITVKVSDETLIKLTESQENPLNMDQTSTNCMFRTKLLESNGHEQIAGNKWPN